MFNWPIRKDAPGTSKIHIPRIVVTPPTPATTTKSVIKRKKIPSKACQPVSASPPKLILDPSFWSPQPETPRTRKKRYLFKCRNADCTEQFSSTRQREMHEGHCFTFDEVLISNLCTTVVTLNYISGVQFMLSFYKT